MTNTKIIPIPLQDQAMAANRMALIVGPLENFSREKLVEGFRLIGERSPDFRLGYVKNADGKSYTWDGAAMARIAEELVLVEEEPAPGQLEARAVELAERNSEHPLRIVLAGDYFLMAVDHEYADARQAFGLFEMLVKYAKNDELPVAPKLTEHPLRDAYKAFFGTDMGKARTASKARVKVVLPPAPSTTRTVGSVGALSVGIFQPETVKLLTRAGRERGATTNSLVFSAALNRLSAEPGYHAHGRATYDLRPFLPDGVSASGNFLAALPVASSDAKVIGDSIESNLKTGAPLLAATVGDLRTRALGRLGRKQNHGSDSTFNGEVDFVFSGMGVARVLESLPYKTKEPIYFAYTRPTIAAQVTTNLIRLKQRLYFSLSYNSAAIPTEVMERVIRDVAADPLRWAYTEPTLSNEALSGLPLSDVKEAQLIVRLNEEIGDPTPAEIVKIAESVSSE